MPGRVIELGEAQLQLIATREKEQRVMAAADQYRARLAGAKIFFTDLATVLARRYPQRDPVFVEHHGAIGRSIDPVVLRVAHDDEIVGPDIAPAVQFV